MTHRPTHRTDVECVRFAAECAQLQSHHSTDDAPAQRPTAVARARSLVALLVGTALLYLWNLGASGYANDFYAAAVQAGTKSWKAFFFGSFDSSNFITVDKPPASLWPMELSGRIFGFNSWSMLVPQALMGVPRSWLLYPRSSAGSAWRRPRSPARCSPLPRSRC